MPLTERQTSNWAYNDSGGVFCLMQSVQTAAEAGSADSDPQRGWMKSGRIILVDSDLVVGTNGGTGRHHFPGGHHTGRPERWRLARQRIPHPAIDDDINTKFLHFKGQTQPTGFQVSPSIGSTIVTGLTLTTANDAPERDPVTFELSGSTTRIDGPYTLIARGDIVDFAGATSWPRFTKNTTPITFPNKEAYAHYQLLFTHVRDAAHANSMQIAEVELLGVPPELLPPEEIPAQPGPIGDGSLVISEFMAVNENGFPQPSKAKRCTRTGSRSITGEPAP